VEYSSVSVSFTLITEFAICTSLLRFKTRSGLSRALNRERMRQRKKEEKDGNEVGLGFKGKNKTCTVNILVNNFLIYKMTHLGLDLDGVKIVNVL
jgi:hypothetical protein